MILQKGKSVITPKYNFLKQNRKKFVKHIIQINYSQPHKYLYLIKKIKNFNIYGYYL